MTFTLVWDSPAQPHEFAEDFPWMDQVAFADLREDIKAHGVREPIVLLGGKILDGRNRWKACQSLGIDCPAVEYDGSTDRETVYAWVRSKNLTRRHLNPSQLAAVAARMAERYAAWAAERQRETQQQIGAKPAEPAAEGGSLGRAAAEVGVSRRSAAKAKKVKDAAPEVFAKVEAGELSVTAAVASLKEPPAIEFMAEPQAYDELEPAFTAGREVADIAKRVAALGRETAIALKKYGQFLQQTAPHKVKTDFSNLVVNLENLVPYAACPECDRKGCNYCGFLGWVNERRMRERAKLEGRR